MQACSELGARKNVDEVGKRQSEHSGFSSGQALLDAKALQRDMIRGPLLSISPPAMYYDPVQHFTGIIEPPRFSAPRYYSMTPYVVRDSDGVEYLFTCHNSRSGITNDHIFVTYFESSGQRKSYPVVGSNVQPPGVPTHSSAPWDGHHICDPAVVQGSFTMGIGRAAKSFKYALFYNGNDSGNGYVGPLHNQLGVAFANSLRGPWTRYPFPVLWHKYSDSDWGIGQPSVTAVDSMNGKVLLFYTQGNSQGTATYRRTITLRDSAKGFEIGPEIKVVNTGLSNNDAAYPGVFANADFIYDAFRDRFIMIRDIYSTKAVSSYPTFIGDMVEIADIPARDLWANSNAWRSLALLTPAQTGYFRNHNAGLARNSFGGLLQKDGLDIFVSISCANNAPDVSKQCPDSSGSNHFSYKVLKYRVSFSPNF